MGLLSGMNNAVVFVSSLRQTLAKSGEKTEASTQARNLEGQDDTSSPPTNHLNLLSIAPDAERIVKHDSRKSNVFAGLGSSTDLKNLYSRPAGEQIERRADGRGQSQAHAEVQQREYTVKKGDTIESIAQKELGKGASPESLRAYTELVKGINTDQAPGDKILLPTIHKDGTFSLINPDDSSETYKYLGASTFRVENSQTKEGFVHRTGADGVVTKDSWGPHRDDNAKQTVYADGSERTEYKDGRGFMHQPGGEEKHWGPKDEDNWTRGRDGAKLDTHPDGSVTTSWKDGTEVRQYKDGRGYSKNADGEVHAWGPKLEDNYQLLVDGTKCWKDSWGFKHTARSDGEFGVGNERFHLGGSTIGEYQVTDSKGGNVQLRRDLAVVQTGKDGTVTRYDKNFDQTVSWADGTTKQNNLLSGVGYTQKPDGQGGYVKHHWGKRPEENYEEKFDAKSGITTSVDARGDKTTKWPNNGVKVERHDQSGYVRQPDGSEHHWGPGEKDNSDSARDFSTIQKSRKELDKIADRDMPEKDRALFKENLSKLEDRAKREHLPPDEVTKTYEQLNRLLRSTDAKVNKNDRLLLAESFAHHLNHDDLVDQGKHGTCNVTVIAERGFSRHPSKLAEMVATTAIEGKWTAADGKVITLDPRSMIPRAEERNNPPKDDERSYAVLMLNLVMVNDATQRRIPPVYYRQENPDPHLVDDTGERIYGSSGKPMTEREVYEDFSTFPATRKYRDVPLSQPTLNDSEIYKAGSRLFGVSDFYLTAGKRADGDGVVKYETQQQLHDKLVEIKNQHRLPIVIAVNGLTTPFGSGAPGTVSGGHVVSVRDYDPVGGRVKISNQWGKGSDKWVTIKEVYENSMT